MKRSRKTKLIMVRHGKTSWNQERRIQGQTETDLLDEAIEEVKKLAKQLKKHSIKAVYSSTLRRAIKTAELIKEELGIDNLELRDDLRERNYGPLEGKKVEEVLQEYGENFFDLDPLGVEKRELLKDRTIKALIEISKKHPDETIVVVTHGGNISELLKHTKDTFERVPNATPFIFEIEDGEVKLLSTNLD